MMNDTVLLCEKGCVGEDVGGSGPVETGVLRGQQGTGSGQGRGRAELLTFRPLRLPRKLPPGSLEWFVTDKSCQWST